MPSIYELTDDFLKVQEMIEQGEYDEETLKNTLECIECEIEVKAENYAKIIKNLEGNNEGIKKEELRLNNKRKSIENNIKFLKDNLYNAMKITGKEKFKTNLFSFNIQKNPPSVKLIEGKKIPKNYLIPQDPKIDTLAIKEDLKSGARLAFAELQQSESLRIR